MTGSAREPDARADWQRRIDRRLTDTRAADESLALSAPTDVRAITGTGHVRLDWTAVDGAAGYLIERTSADGAASLLEHGGSDVPAVPSAPFADTGVDAGVEYSYRVAAVAGAEYPGWNWSDPVTGQAIDAAPGAVEVGVDAARTVGELHRVWAMVGSERLTQLRFGDDGNGNDIGTEFAEALRIAHEDLGATHVRAHAILHDDNHIVSRDDDGKLGYDFAGVDALYDQILQIGIRPIVELGFMPAALARDSGQTVFGYRGIISPPTDWSEWYEVVSALTAHLVERYGLDEVARWAFEVWNEPNLEVFWTGTQQDYLRLYDESARAVKDIDERLRIGGPSTAAGEWVETLAAHAEQDKIPLDFVTSHTYGNLPLDTRPTILRHGFDGIPTWWTEWGVGATHFGRIHDGVLGATFVLSGFHEVQGRIQALSYWVISDHFEELGRPPALFHNGFGLLSVGNLRKPRYWAAHLAAHQGDHVLAAQLDGDGADVLVRGWATRHDDGTVDVLVWNGTINADLMNGKPALDRDVRVSVSGLTAAGYRASLARVDEQHSNICAGYPDGVAWPDAELWQQLRATDRLHEQPLPDVPVGANDAAFEFVLPMPGVARVRLTAAPTAAGHEEEDSR
ncbi:MAG: xylan 1,4-beta-xylosidase [Actinomycetota bacterium]|nr:xylan 1,4-beta-xylosidase [Actinomycetota bacterium]